MKHVKAIWCVFPTRVGVNRWTLDAKGQVGVFPTRVGVNRSAYGPSITVKTFSPHAWG